MYPEVRHLLCKWHIDRLMLIYLTSAFNIATYIYFVQNRAWQRKLNALVKDPEQKANMYACLWTLMNEEDSDTFKDKEKTFAEYWSTRESKFIEYYNSEYRPRAGTHLSCVLTGGIFMYKHNRKMGHVLPSF